MSIIGRAYNKLTRSSGNLMRQAGGEAGLYDRFYKQARGIRILVYHGICAKDHTRFNPIFLLRETFEQHLRFFKKHFNIVSLDDVFQQRLSADKFNVCLTFDDGFANNFHYVLPLLKQYEVPAAFFITGIREAGFDILWNDFLNIVTKYGPTDIDYKGRVYRKNRFGRYISNDNGTALADELRNSDFEAKEEMMEIFYDRSGFRNNDADKEYWQLMSEPQIKQLAASRWATIGAHGYYHNDLVKISPELAKDEITRSRNYLERITGNVIKAFAFPYGSYNTGLKEMAVQAGFIQLLGADPGDEEDSYLRSRFTLNPFMKIHKQMQAIIKGNYDHWK